MSNPFARLLCRPLAISEMGARELRALATSTKSGLWEVSQNPETGGGELSHDVMGNAVPRPYDLIDGTRVIPMFGPMARGYGLVGQYWGMCDTDAIRRQIIAAGNDASVTRIALHVRSPGGDAQLCEETGRAFQAAGLVKPTLTFCDQLMASAAYYVGSGANTVYASPSSMIGNIGSYCVMVDDTEYWAKLGIQFIVARSGAFKGAGIDGFTEEQLAEIQSWADAFGSQFREFIAEMRPTIDLADMQGQIFLKNDLTESQFCDFIAPDLESAIAHNKQLTTHRSLNE